MNDSVTITTFEERVARQVITHFNNLPRRSKPRDLDDGTREWTPISGIVLAKDRDGANEHLNCVSVGTGSKCLPQTLLPHCRGQVLHDCHAEVLALRGLNHFLLREGVELLERRQQGDDSVGNTDESPFLDYCVEEDLAGEDSWPFRLREDISIHMFSTEAPCGDASMEILMASKPDEERKPWAPIQAKGVLQGRGYFADLGVIRRKPSRPDAPPTLSKSCTDKLTMKTVTSLLSFPTFLFLAPYENLYLSSLILPSQKYSRNACERAFGPSGRMRAFEKQEKVSHYAYQPFEVKTVDLPVDNLPYSRPVTGKARIGNISALWIAGHFGGGSSVNETLINGVKQGFKQFSLDDRRCSVVSRLNMLLLGKRLTYALQAVGRGRLYNEILADADLSYDVCKEKHTEMGRPQRAKMKISVAHELGGWPRNSGDGDWKIVRSP